MTRAGILLLLVLGSACSRGPAEDGDVLIWARSADSTTLDPAEVEWTEDAKIVQNVFETLVAFGRDSTELEGRLAERWSFGEDGKTLAFELRKGVTFHDGTPFDSESVVFTFERLLDPDHPHAPRAVPYRNNFAVIGSVAADGPHRVVFTLREPSAVILQNLTLFGAAIVPKGVVEERGGEFASRPVGTGPYRLARWERTVKIELERNPDYWGPAPAIPRVIVIPVASPQTAVEMLKRGEVHAVDHPTHGDVKALADDPSVRVDSAVSLNVCYLAFNMEKAPYDNPDFRRAVSLALDRRSLVGLAYYGLAEEAANLAPPAVWKDLCPTPPYEHDPEKAKELFAKVELPAEGLELYHMTFSRPYVPEPQRVAEWVKDQLGKAGIEVRLSGFDKAAYTAKYREKDHPMVLLGWNADIADPDNFYYPLLHGASKEEMNTAFFDDAAFNEAVSKAQSERDASARAALYTEAYGRYRELLPHVPLVHVAQYTIVSPRLRYHKHPLETRYYEAAFGE